MKLHCRQLSLVVALVASIVLCLPAAATDVDMSQLPPVVEPLRCLICHQTDPGETSDTTLNLFGADFLANGRLWDDTLANQNSDGDGCSNGFELGDVDGDGENDGNVTELQSNPGVEDCNGASVDHRTWGELKALFGSK